MSHDALQEIGTDGESSERGVRGMVMGVNWSGRTLTAIRIGAHHGTALAHQFPCRRCHISQLARVLF